MVAVEQLQVSVYSRQLEVTAERQLPLLQTPLRAGLGGSGGSGAAIFALYCGLVLWMAAANSNYTGFLAAGNGANGALLVVLAKVRGIVRDLVRPPKFQGWWWQALQAGTGNSGAGGGGYGE